MASLKRKHITTVLLTLLVFPAGFVAARATSATAESIQVAAYAAEDIGLPDGYTDVAAVGIDDQGRVIVNVITGGRDLVMIFQDGSYQEIGSAEFSVIASAVNGRGDIAGWAGVAGSGTGDPDPVAVLINDDSIAEMPGAMPQSRAFGVSPEGEVVGQAAAAPDPTRFLPALWIGGDLEFLVEDEDVVVGLAADMNTIGTVVGWIEVGDGSVSAFSWRNEVFVELDVPGGRVAEAVAINEAGLIVGSGVISGDGDQLREAGAVALLWDETGVTQPGEIAGQSWSAANDINDVGIVVGVAGFAGGDDPNRSTAAVIWTGDETFDLNENVVSLNGLHLQEAVAINSFGQILCAAVDSDGEPTLVVLSVVGN